MNDTAIIASDKELIHALTIADWCMVTYSEIEPAPVGLALFANHSLIATADTTHQLHRMLQLVQSAGFSIEDIGLDCVSWEHFGQPYNEVTIYTLKPEDGL